MPFSPNQTYTRREILKTLKISSWILRKIIKKGELRPIKINNKDYRFLGLDLLQWITEKQEGVRA